MLRVGVGASCPWTPPCGQVAAGADSGRRVDRPGRPSPVPGIVAQGGAHPNIAIQRRSNQRRRRVRLRLSTAEALSYMVFGYRPGAGPGRKYTEEREMGAHTQGPVLFAYNGLGFPVAWPEGGWLYGA